MTIIAVIGDPGFEKILAVGCYFLDPESQIAEVAFSVEKAWQGKGISTVIQTKLADFARDRGIKGLTAYTSNRNRGMIHLFNKLPYNISKKSDGEILTLFTDFKVPEPDS